LLYSGFVAFTAGGDDLLARFVGPIDDPSWMPPGQEVVRLAGRHYFGDWQIFIGWGRDPNPYVLWPLVLNSLPGAYYFLAMLGLLPFSISIWIFFGLTLGMSGLAAFLLLSRYTSPQRLMITVILFGSSIGMLFTLGRGALQGVAMGLVGVAIALGYKDYYLRTSNADTVESFRGETDKWSWRRMMSAVVLAAAIMLKPYFAVLLLWPMLNRRWRYLCVTVGIVVVTSIAGFALLPGGFMTTVQGLVRGLSPYSSGDMTYHMGGAVSLVGFLLWLMRVIAGPNAVAQVLEGSGPIAMWTPALLWILALVAIFAMRALPRWVFMVLLLASTQLILPTAQVYTMVWAPYAVILILMGLAHDAVQPLRLEGKVAADQRFVAALCTTTVIAASVLSLVQFPRNVTGAMGWPVPTTLILSPGLLLLAASVCLVGSGYLRIRQVQHRGSRVAT
jgi:arabinofuranan 3-O-arabinosyltransferase